MAKLQGLLFDKDGTLIDYHVTWLGPMQRLTLELSRGDDELADVMMCVAGFDPEKGRVKADSTMAAGNTHDLADVWLPFVAGHTLESLVGLIDQRALAESSLTSAPVVPLAAFFRRLRRQGLKLGIATSDSEAGAKSLLEREGALDLVDFVSGYDSGNGSKTGPGMALAFAEAAGLAPESLGVVGDNITDLQMGRAAGYGLSIGVLTGTSDTPVLQVFADAVLPSIAELESWLIAEGRLVA